MNNNMYLGRKKHNRFRYWKLVVDLITIVLGAVTIFIGIYVAFMVSERFKWLPALFLGAALVNLIEALKKMYYGKYVAGMLFFLATITIAAFAVVSYLAIWQQVL